MMESRLYTHSKFKADPTEDEDLWIQGFDLFSSEVKRLTDIAWSKEEMGDEKGSYKIYKSVSIFYMMLNYVRVMKEDIDRQGFLYPTNLVGYLKDKYKTDCIEENLKCMSKRYCTDYTKVWEELLSLYGIDLQDSIDTDCCVGLSEMIVNDPDDCFSFIIGDCGENELPASEGEYDDSHDDSYAN